jgi:hypothetical protein
VYTGPAVVQAGSPQANANVYSGGIVPPTRRSAFRAERAG